MRVFRIHRPDFAALDPGGASLRGGRWNPRGVGVVYTAPAYEGTLLEMLARAGTGRLPKGLVASRIALPGRCSPEVLEPSRDPGRFAVSLSRKIGLEWIESGRSLAFQVPSSVARPWGRNILLNPRHPDFSSVRVEEVAEVRWDPRLFPARSADGGSTG